MPIPNGPRAFFAVAVGCAIAGAVAFAGAGPNARPTHSQSSATARIEVLDQIGGAMNALALVGDVIFVGVGPRVVALDVSVRDAAPAFLGQSAILPGVITRLIHHEDHVFVIASGPKETHVVALNVVDPTHPLEAGRIRTNWQAFDFTIAGDALVIAELEPAERAVSAPAALEIIAIVDTRAMEPVAWLTIDIAAEIEEVESIGHHVYALDGDDVVRIFDVSDPTRPRPIGVLKVPDARSIGVSSAPKRLFVSTGDYLIAFELDAPGDPVEIARVGSSSGDRLRVTGTTVWLYTWNPPTDVERYRVRDLAALDSFTVSAGVEDLAFSDGDVYSTSADSSVFVWSALGSGEVEPRSEWRSAGASYRVDVDEGRTWSIDRTGVDVVDWGGGARASSHWRSTTPGSLTDIVVFEGEALVSQFVASIHRLMCTSVPHRPIAGACTVVDSITLDGSGGTELIGRQREHLYAATRNGNIVPIALDEALGLRAETAVRYSEATAIGNVANVRMAFLDGSTVAVPALDGLARLDLSDPAVPVLLGSTSLDEDRPPASTVIKGGDHLFAMADEHANLFLPPFSESDERRLFVLDGAPSGDGRVVRRISGLPENVARRAPGHTLIYSLPYALVYLDPWIITQSRTGLAALDPLVESAFDGVSDRDLAEYVFDLAPLESEGEFIAAAGDAGMYRLRIMDAASPTEAPTAAPIPLPTRSATSVPTAAAPHPSVIYLPSVSRPTSGPSIPKIELESVLGGSVRDIVEVDGTLLVARGRHVEAWVDDSTSGSDDANLRFVGRSPLLSGPVQAIDVDGDIVVAALGVHGLRALRRLADGGFEIVGEMRTADIALDVVIESGFAYVAASAAGVQVVALDDLTALNAVARLETTHPAVRIAVADGTLAILASQPRSGGGSTGESEIVVADVVDPMTPIARGRFPSEASEGVVDGARLRDVVVAADTLFALDRRGRVFAIDIGDRSSPELLDEIDACGSGTDTIVGRLALHADRLIVGGAFDCWLEIVDVSNPRRLERMGGIDRSWDEAGGNSVITGIAVSDTSAWTAAEFMLADGGGEEAYFDPSEGYLSGSLASIDLKDASNPVLRSDRTSPWAVAGASAIPEGVALLVEPIGYWEPRTASIWRLPISEGVLGTPIQSVTLPSEENPIHGPLPIAADWPLAFAITASGMLHSVDLEAGLALDVLDLEGHADLRTALAIGAHTDGARILFAQINTGSGVSLIAIDAADPTRLRATDRRSIGAGIVGIAAIGDRIYVPKSGGGVSVYRFTDSGTLVDEPELPFDGHALGIFARDQHLFVLDFESLSVFEAATSSPPALLSNLALSGYLYRIGGDGERVYVGGDRLTAIDVSSPTTPRVLAAWNPTEGDGSGAAHFDSIVGSSSWIFGVRSLESGGKQQFFRLSDSSPPASR